MGVCGSLAIDPFHGVYVAQQIFEHVGEQADRFDLGRRGMERREQRGFESVRIADIMKSKEPVERDKIPFHATVDVPLRLELNGARHDTCFGGAAAEYCGSPGQIMAMVEEEAPHAGEDLIAGFSGERVEHSFALFVGAAPMRQLQCHPDPPSPGRVRYRFEQNIGPLPGSRSISFNYFCQAVRIAPRLDTARELLPFGRCSGLSAHQRAL